MRKTKIVCTLGPATDSYETIKNLIKAGMNVARINMSHGTYDDHRKRIALVKRARAELSASVALMLDTKGPEIRIKNFAAGRAVLKNGSLFTLKTEDVPGDDSCVSITYKTLYTYLKKNDRVLINDGLVELRVVQIKGEDIVTKVVNGGVLTNHKGINVPKVKIDMPYISDRDREDFMFCVAEDFDYVALSFVRTPEDVRQVRTLLDDAGAHDIQLIAKIESREGVNHLEKILEISDGAMVARGDMGVEIPFEELPGIQKSMIEMCYKRGKKVITATQMLESMVESPRPTRAEISDVANAIYDGTSAIMLSAETAVGKFPVQAVKTMAKIAVQTECDIDYFKRFRNSNIKIETITDAISHSTVAASYDLSAKAIVAVSKSGATARKISRFRPNSLIIAAVTSVKAYHQLAMNWGVAPILTEEQPNSDALFHHAIECTKRSKLVKIGDIVVVTAGVPVGQSGKTNTMRIEEIS